MRSYYAKPKRPAPHSDASVISPPPFVQLYLSPFVVRDSYRKLINDMRANRRNTALRISRQTEGAGCHCRGSEPNKKPGSARTTTNRTLCPFGQPSGSHANRVPTRYDITSTQSPHLVKPVSLNNGNLRTVLRHDLARSAIMKKVASTAPSTSLHSLAPASLLLHLLTNNGPSRFLSPSRHNNPTLQSYQSRNDTSRSPNEQFHK